MLELIDNQKMIKIYKENVKAEELQQKNFNKLLQDYGINEKQFYERIFNIITTW